MEARSKKRDLGCVQGRIKVFAKLRLTAYTVSYLPFAIVCRSLKNMVTRPFLDFDPEFPYEPVSAVVSHRPLHSRADPFQKLIHAHPLDLSAEKLIIIIQELK